MYICTYLQVGMYEVLYVCFSQVRSTCCPECQSRESHLRHLGGRLDEHGRAPYIRLGSLDPERGSQ